MRGKGFRAFPSTSKYRITPAYAGKSVPVDPRRLSSGDHPRLCGEKISHALLMMLDRGSPPPMRGKAWQEQGQAN